jgi:hypothetical protein
MTSLHEPSREPPKLGIMPPYVVVLLLASFAAVMAGYHAGAMFQVGRESGTFGP